MNVTQEGVREEWDNAAEAWVKFVREGKDYYRDGLNNPAAFKLIGNIKDKRSYSRSGTSS